MRLGRCRVGWRPRPGARGASRAVWISGGDPPKQARHTVGLCWIFSGSEDLEYPGNRPLLIVSRDPNRAATGPNHEPTNAGNGGRVLPQLVQRAGHVSPHRHMFRSRDFSGSSLLWLRHAPAAAFGLSGRPPGPARQSAGDRTPAAPDPRSFWPSPGWPAPHPASPPAAARDPLAPGSTPGSPTPNDSPIRRCGPPPRRLPPALMTDSPPPPARTSPRSRPQAPGASPAPGSALPPAPGLPPPSLPPPVRTGSGGRSAPRCRLSARARFACSAHASRVLWSHSFEEVGYLPRPAPLRSLPVVPLEPGLRRPLQPVVGHAQRSPGGSADSPPRPGESPKCRAAAPGR